MQSFEGELLTLLPRLRRFSRSLTGDVSDADDLCQVAIVRALQARSQWSAGTRLDAWLFKILRNCWIDEIRARTRRSATFLPEEEGIHVSTDGVEEVNMRSQAREIADAMNGLAPEQREAVSLVLVEGFAYREAADILEIPIGTLTSRLVRGRQALIQRLEEA